MPAHGTETEPQHSAELRLAREYWSYGESQVQIGAKAVGSELHTWKLTWDLKDCVS
jgi:hypothetical protein